MAGSYDDVPDHRMAYDRDGTVVVNLLTTSGLANTMSQANRETINNEDTDLVNVYGTFGNIGSVQYGVAFLFPEARDLAGYYASLFEVGGSRNAVQWSNNTTTGLDGTWTTITNPYIGQNYSKELMRNEIEPLAVSGATAIRFLYDMGGGGSRSYMVSNIHLYGTASAPNRLRFWHPTLDQEVEGHHLDWGNASRAATLFKTFRVKNPSATLTAFSTELTNEALTDTAPTNVSQHTFSFDDVTYTSSLSLGDLSPGEISPIVYVKRLPPATAQIALWWTRVVAMAASYA